MTTIAYRDGVMVGDGHETTQNDDQSSWYTIRDNCIKVFKLKDGRLFGYAHGSEDCERLHQALIKNVPPPKLEDVNGLLVDRRRRIWLYEGNIWQPLRVPFYSIGSGSICATCAMDAGASALEAVKIACKRDLWTGGKITSVRLS